MQVTQTAGETQNHLTGNKIAMAIAISPITIKVNHTQYGDTITRSLSFDRYQFAVIYPTDDPKVVYPSTAIPSPSLPIVWLSEPFLGYNQLSNLETQRADLIATGKTDGGLFENSLNQLRSLGYEYVWEPGNINKTDPDFYILNPSSVKLDEAGSGPARFKEQSWAYIWGYTLNQSATVNPLKPSHHVSNFISSQSLLAAGAAQTSLACNSSTTVTAPPPPIPITTPIPQTMPLIYGFRSQTISVPKMARVDTEPAEDPVTSELLERFPGGLEIFVGGVPGPREVTLRVVLARFNALDIKSEIPHFMGQETEITISLNNPY